MKVILASGNKKKLVEMQQILQPHDLELIPQSVFSLTDAEETGLTFVENALIKARHAARQTGLAAIADDSGLEVDALAGRPGIYSARFSAAHYPDGATDERNNALLLKKLNGFHDEQRRARFHCVIVYLRHAEDPVPIICQGSWEGRILQAPQGKGGFGYDPLFYVPAKNCSAAQLPAEEKHQLSHRGKALSQLAAHLKNDRGEVVAHRRS